MPQLIIALVLLYVAIFILTAALTYAAAWISGLVAATISYFAFRETVRTHLTDPSTIVEYCSISITSSGPSMYVHEDRVNNRVEAQSPSTSVHIISLAVTVGVLLILTIVFEPFSSPDSSSVFVAVAGWIASLIIVPAVANQFASLEKFQSYARETLRDYKQSVSPALLRYAQILHTVREADEACRSVGVSLEPTTLHRVESVLMESFPSILRDPYSTSEVMNRLTTIAEEDVRELQRINVSLSRLDSKIEEALDTLYARFSLILKQKIDKIVEAREDQKVHVLSKRKWPDFTDFVEGCVGILERDIAIARREQTESESTAHWDDPFVILDIDPATPLDQIDVSDLRQSFNWIYHPDKPTRNLAKIQGINAALDELKRRQNEARLHA